MGVSDEDVRVLAARVRITIGDDLPAWPGGWPGQVELALIDAVFSIRARYGQRGTECRPSTGVFAVVERWLEHRGEPADDLIQLREMDVERLTHILGNKARISGRTKAEVVVDAASRLSEVGLRHASDFHGSAEQKAAYIGVRGCGGITWAYFGMLLGQPNSKPDTWVQRYVRTSVRSDISTEDCRRLVNAVAKDLDVDSTQLDHAIWLYARGRPQPVFEDAASGDIVWLDVTVVRIRSRVTQLGLPWAWLDATADDDRALTIAVFPSLFAKASRIETGDRLHVHGEMRSTAYGTDVVVARSLAAL